MAPKKRKSATQPRARTERVISRDVLTPTKPAFVEQNLDTCGACLLPVETDAKLGLVDACTHCFHFECVERWSKTENSCPQCKIRFFWLACYTPEGKRTSLQRVERRDQEGEEDDDFEDIQVCELCKQVGEEANLLLCDGMNGTCNAAFHTTCVGLDAVPRGSWFCPDCVERGFDTDAHDKRGKRQQGPPVESLESRTMQQQQQQQQQRPATQQSEPSDNVLKRTVAGSAASVAMGATGSSSRNSSSTAPSNSDGGGSRISTARGSAVVPSQLRLNALACVTPPVEVPTFQMAIQSGAGANDGTRGNAHAGGGRSQGGLFASFVQRRRQQQGKAGGVCSTDPSTSFIKLTPQYEEDFMGGKISK